MSPAAASSPHQSDISNILSQDAEFQNGILRKKQLPSSSSAQSTPLNSKPVDIQQQSYDTVDQQTNNRNSTNLSNYILIKNSQSNLNSLNGNNVINKQNNSNGSLLLPINSLNTNSTTSSSNGIESKINDLRITSNEIK